MLKCIFLSIIYTESAYIPGILQADRYFLISLNILMTNVFGIKLNAVVCGNCD